MIWLCACVRHWPDRGLVFECVTCFYCCYIIYEGPLNCQFSKGFQRRGIHRVWKGILGIRDLTKIRCGDRENHKYLDGIRDLTAPQEAGLTKIWSWEAGFFACLLGIRETLKVSLWIAEALALELEVSSLAKR